MLKLIGEMSIALLAVYAVRKPVAVVIDRAATSTSDTWYEAAYEGFKDGVEAGCLVIGSVASFPITAPVGACELVRDVYGNREAIATSCTETKDWLCSYFVKDEESEHAVAQLELTV